jgi:putative phage-type endonuclease
VTERIGTAEYVGTFQPGSDDWHKARAQGLGGSEIAAVVGLSPWESRFSLWMRKAGATSPQPESPEMEWGTRLEDAVAAKFAEGHPEWAHWSHGTWRHVERPWQIANPDRLIWSREYQDEDADRTVVRVLECKTALYAYEWGPAGSDEIPVYYRAQVLWYLDTFGLDVAHVAVLIGGHDYREYVIPASPEDQAFLREAGREFLASVDADLPPDIDAHSATYQALRELHPEIEPRTVDLSPVTALAWVGARAALKAAEGVEQLARSRLAAEMGMAQHARYGPHRLASRQTKNGGTPFVVAARNLPDPDRLDPDQLDPDQTG